MKSWIKIGLFFAVWMFLFMTFITPYIMKFVGLGDEGEVKFPMATIIINAVLYTITGLLIGFINRNNKKKIDN